MLTGWRLALSKFFLIPQRYILGIMGFFAIVNAYTMRVSLSMAITEMVVPLAAHEYYDPNACLSDNPGSNNSAVKDQNLLYDWDEKTQGLILSSFYWGYVITHLPGGILAEKFGGKYSLGLGILSTAIFTIITPWVIIASGGNWKILVALRVVEGLGEGVTYPALTALLAKWVPVKERATIGSMVYAGSQFGTILSNFISGELIRYTEDWASVFYFFGCLGVIWFILWVLLCYSDPSSHPYISDKEKEYLDRELANVSSSKLPIPWKAILTSVPMWALVITQIGHDWGFFTMVTDLPKYMKDVLKFNVSQNGLWSSLPYLVMWFTSLGCGWFCDFLVKRKLMTLTFSRKFFTSLGFLIPQRYVLGIMGFLAVVNAYAMRVTLSISITEMIRPSNVSSKTEYADVCDVGPIINSTSSNAVTDPDKLFDWDESTQGLILGAFYWGYLITHVPGGVLAAKFGGKYTLGLGILSTGIFTLITPWVILASNGSWKWLVFLRVVEGLGEGMTYPALNTMLAQWVPLGERSKIGSLVYAGGQIGTIVCNLISGQLITATKDWASVFYLFGTLGVIWFVFFQFLCYSDPKHHPFLSDKEREYLETEMDGVSSELPPIPWKALVTSVPLWALIAAQIGHDWGFYTMVTDLPKYMKEVLGFDVSQNGVWNSIPYLAMWIASMSGGFLCDWLIVRNYMTITDARKFFTCFAAIGPAIFIMAASYAGCNSTLAVWMFTIAMGFMGTFYCGMKVNALDLSPNFAGIIMGITNGIGAGAGIITPYLTGAITENHTVTEWRSVFWVSFGIFSVTSVVYMFFGSGEEQWWNNPGHLSKKKSATLESQLNSDVKNKGKSSNKKL